jgi:hypothetical protein
MSISDPLLDMLDQAADHKVQSDAELLERVLPMLIRLGDFIGNGEIDPDRPDSMGARCDLISDIRNALARRGKSPSTSTHGRDVGGHLCRDGRCRQGFATEAARDEHELAACHWDEVS